MGFQEFLGHHLERPGLHPRPVLDHLGGEVLDLRLQGGSLISFDRQDTAFPEKKTDDRQLYIRYQLNVKLPATEINTGYGVRFEEGQGSNHYIELAQKTGFMVVAEKKNQGWFFIELKKQP